MGFLRRVEKRDVVYRPGRGLNRSDCFDSDLLIYKAVSRFGPSVLPIGTSAQTYFLGCCAILRLPILSAAKSS
jgi:hypothetical protein